MKFIQLIVFWLFANTIVLAQPSGNEIASARTIADKIIRETPFDYKLVPLRSNTGISRFTIPGCNRGKEGAIWYSLGHISSDKDTTGILGFSFRGRITVFINSREVFSGYSGQIGFTEYAYSRYKFDNQVPVWWLKGKNNILVKCEGGTGDSEILMLPQNDADWKDENLDFQPMVEEQPGAFWMICGPWITGSGDGMDFKFPPEKEIRDYYESQNEILGWSLDPPPLVRTLVIPPANSFQRESYADWTYANGGTMLGILNLYQVTGDETYLDFVKQVTGNMWENYENSRWQYEKLHDLRGSFHKMHRMTMLDDSGGPAIPYAELESLEKDTLPFSPILLRTLEYVLNGQERLNDGTFSRPEPEAATVWADDLFMSVPFLLRMAKITGNPDLYDEVADQVIRFYSYLRNPESGLCFHGWYDSRKENSPVQWARANGWMVWATSEALMLMPAGHPKYNAVKKIYKSHLEALVSFQDPSGMWHQVLDHPETYEETSSTALFTLGIARGVRMGWLNRRYAGAAIKGWDALRGKIEEDGTVKGICRGTEIGENIEFYQNRQCFDNDPRGLGAMLTAGCEIHLLKESLGSTR